MASCTRFLVRFVSHASIVLAALAVAGCATPPPAAPQEPGSTGAVTTPGAPKEWVPAFWDRAMREAQAARDQGDRATAERACARGILYVQAQTIRVLYGYAELLDRQNYGSGVTLRGKVQRLEQARDEQAVARKSGDTYLGFDPAAELKAYADALAGAQRNTDSLIIEALSSAYRYAQEANARRTQLRRQGKDPFGEC